MRKIIAEVERHPMRIEPDSLPQPPDQKKQIVFVNAKSDTMHCAIAAYTSVIAEQLRNLGYDVQEVGVDQLKHASPQSLTKHIKSLSNGKEQIVHLQYPHKGYPQTFDSSFLQSFKDNVLTLHEFSSRPAYIQDDIDKTIQYAKRVIFTQQYEQDYAYCRLGEIVGSNTVISIPSNIRVSKNVTHFNNNLNIINFGGIRRKTKGIEDVIKLAKELKDFTLSLERGPKKELFNSIRVVIAGNVREKSFDDYKYFISLIYSFTEKEHIILKGIDSFKELDAFLEGKEKSLPVDFYINQTDEELSQLLAKSSFAYLPYPDGVSQRRGTFAACAEHECIVLTTKSDKTPYEMMSMEGAVFSTDPKQAFAQIVELVDNIDERLRLQESITQLVSDRIPDNIAKEHVALYEGKKELLNSIPEHLKSRTYEEMLFYSKLLVEDKGLDIKEFIESSGPYVPAKNFAYLNNMQNHTLVKNSTKKSTYETIDEFYKTKSTDVFRLLVKKALETPIVLNTKNALTYLVQKLQNNENNLERAQIIAQELLLYSSKVSTHELTSLDTKERIIKTLSKFAPYLNPKNSLPNHIKELIVFAGGKKAGVTDISKFFTSAFRKKNHRLKSAVIIDFSKLLKDIFPFTAENSPLPLTDSMQKKVHHSLALAKKSILDVFEKVAECGYSVIINYENPDYQILNKIEELAGGGNFSRKQLVGVGVNSGVIERRKTQETNSVCNEKDTLEVLQTHQNFFDYFLHAQKSHSYSSCLLFDNGREKNSKTGLVPKPVYFSSMRGVYSSQEDIKNIFDSWRRNEPSKNYPLEALSQTQYLSNPVLDTARNILHSGKYLEKQSNLI
jgi:hypothetical protein